jgi:hypothetical protein
MEGEGADEWPVWAVNCFICLGVACCALLWGTPSYTRANHTSDSPPTTTSPGFRRFQFQYLAVYLTVMLADWLQGTNMYTLYQSYGVDVSALFLTGFSSSALFGTFVGLFVDRYGRRAGCIAFCILELVINALEHIPSMPLLLLGRVLGGISTSLLFSAFESWMVCEHRHQGFPEAWLADTFRLSTVGNGLVAILAGFLAQLAADALGEIGPFQIAIMLTAFALIQLMFWSENYGHVSTDGSESQGRHSHTSIYSAATKCITSNPGVLLVGLTQSLYEGAVYTFVFMWVPTLQSVVPLGNLPTGLVFSCFMVCVTIGGALSAALLRHTTVEAASLIVFGLSALSVVLPILRNDFATILASFLILETCVGAFYASSGLLRSKYLPDALQSSVMNIFRLPLNILVVVGTRVSQAATQGTVFGCICIWFVAAAILQVRLQTIANQIGLDNRKKVS